MTLDYRLASFRGDLESIRHIAETRDLKDCYIKGFWGDLKFPLWAVPKSLLTIIGDPIEWNEPYNNILTQLKPKLEAMILWWQETYGIDANKEYPYGELHDCFYSSEPDETPEEILWEDDIESLLMETNSNEIDVELYCAAEKFDYEKVEELLRKGANPNAKLSEDNDIIQRIALESSFLNAEWFGYWWDILTQDAKIKDLPHFMINFIGYAAHERMYYLLKKYSLETPDD